MKRIIFIAGLAIAQDVGEILLSKFPKPNVPPPIVKEWTDAFLKNANIPNIPIRTDPLEAYDWSKDIVSCKNERDWGLTYDDGPSVFTGNVTAELKAVGGKATFFVIGSEILTFHQRMKEAYDNGHQIGIHTWSHSLLITQSNEQIVSEILWTAKAIKEVIGVVPKLVRAPTGAIDERVRAVIQAMGLINVAWVKDTSDWMMVQRNSPVTQNTIVQNFKSWIAEPRNGTGVISLQHDIYQEAAAVIGTTLKMVNAAKYNLKTVTDCTGIAAYDDSLLDKIADIDVYSNTTISSDEPPSAGNSDEKNEKNNGIVVGIPTIENQKNGAVQVSCIAYFLVFGLYFM